MKFYLIVAKGSKKGMPIQIKVDLFLIGSDPVCQLRKSGLAPKHCALITRVNKVFVRDFDSGQNTIVNGSVIAPGQEWPLHAGDRIEVGSLEFLVQFREHQGSPKDVEDWANSFLDVDQEKDIPVTEIEEESREHASAHQAAQAIIDKLQRAKGQVVGRLRIGVEKGFTIVRLNDRVMVDESEINMIKNELCEKLNRRDLRVVLDLKNVSRMSSHGVLMLADFYRWLKPFGSRMALIRSRSEIEHVLNTLGAREIPRFKDKHKAMSSKW